MNEENVVDGITQTATESISKFSVWFAKYDSVIIQYALNILVAVIILIVGMIIARGISNAIQKVLNGRNIDVTVGKFIAMLARYTVLAFTFIAVLGRLGVQTTSIIAILGAAGLAIGLALQGSLSNFAAGILLIVFRPFKVGEYIEAGSAVGTVDSIQIFSTTLRSVDNKTITVPNSKVISGDVVNYSREEDRRVDFKISVAYSADINTVKKVLNDIVVKDDRILQELDITIRLLEINPTSLGFVVRAWVKNSDYWDVYFDLLESFKVAIDQNSIGIPAPKMDIQLHQ